MADSTGKLRSHLSSKGGDKVVKDLKCRNWHQSKGSSCLTPHLGKSFKISNNLPGVEELEDRLLSILSAKAIIEIYSSRFSIEIAFRDLKHHFGFGDYQMTSTTGFSCFVHLYCISFCLWRLIAMTENISRWFMETLMKVLMNLPSTLLVRGEL